MELRNQNILFFARTMKLGGTENVVLQLCEIFKPIVNNVVVCSCGGVNVEKLAIMGIKHYEIPDIEDKKPHTMIKIAKTVKRIVKQENISIIHTHHRMAAFYISFLCLYKQCKFINTSHNTFKNKRKLTQIAYKHGSLIACGEMVKKNLVHDFGLPEMQVTVIHNAVKAYDGNTALDPFIKKLRDQEYFVIGNIGRLSEQKGMKYFIKAIPDIIEKHPQARFIIVGSGEDEQSLKELAEKLNLNLYLSFLGYRDNIQSLMSQLDLIVLSSLWEGLPLTPIEAYSVGKTIVATAVDGTTEIVRDSIDGFLIAPRNSKAIVEKVCYLIEKSEKRSEFEKKALERYKEEFSFDKLANSYINFYERC